jgi:hypothetical protein
MKASLSKITSLAAGIMLALALTLTGCTEDPANNNSGGGGIDDNGQQQGGGDPSGGGGTNYTISELTIKNSTGYTINGIYVKPSTSTDWGSNLYGYSNLADGQSRKLTFSKHLSATNGLDVQLKASSGGYTFTKYKVTVSNGATVTFTASDLNDESNLPSITIQNRTGVSFNAIYIRPSSVPDESSDWGKDYGSLSNNNDKSTSIPIPSSSYTIFDIQMRSSNPTNTYTKKNVTILNGIVLTYTSTDSDNPLIGSPIIVIQNSTSYTIEDIRIKPSTSTDWGSNLGGSLSSTRLTDGQSRTFTLSQSLSDNSVYDIRLRQSSSNGNIFIKYSVTVSDGMIISFTTNDLNDESNLPSITIQNRTGVAFNAIYVKPSESSDWGKDYGSLSNNNDKSISIPIPPSSYTTFDIQMRSSNPTNTYTRNNVTISNGMVLTYTSADSDNPLIGSPIIVIQNNTGYTIEDIRIKPSTSTDWGSNLGGSLSSTRLTDGQSRTFTLSQSLSDNSVYDIRLRTSSSGGNVFIKNDVSGSDGIIVNFTSSDLE